MFASNPWLGVGIGNFNAFYPDFALRGWEYQPGHAHNVYLNALSETGLIGASAFYLFFASQALLLGRAIRSARRVAATRPLWLALTVGAAGAWIAVGLHNGLDNLYVSHIPVQLAIILGLAAGIDRQVRDGAAA
jgi:O-antigen ligase